MAWSVCLGVGFVSRLGPGTREAAGLGSLGIGLSGGDFLGLGNWAKKYLGQWVRFDEFGLGLIALGYRKLGLTPYKQRQK